MPELTSDLRSYVDRLAQLAEEHAAAGTSGHMATGRLEASLPGRRLRPPRRTWVAASLVAALVILFTAVVVADGGPGGDDLQVADTSVPRGASTTAASTTTTTAATSPDTRPDGFGEGGVTPVAGNGMMPGRAVYETDTHAIRTFAPDGSPVDTIQPDPQQPWSQPVRADLAGGWVACGLAGALVWYPSGQSPQVLSETTPDCTTETIHPLQVVDSAGGAMAVYESATGPRAVVLETGDDRAIEIPGLARIEPGGWSAATGRLLVRDGGRYRLFDIDTGEEIAIAAIDAPAGGSFVLAPDAATVAVLAFDEVVVLDLASGAENHRVKFDPLVFPFLSYDGTTVAVPRIPDGGSDASAEVVVADLATGARRTLDVYGTPL